MNTITVERSKPDWQLAADSLPQLICLLDERGRILRANSTLERWGLGDVFTVGGSDLHDTLHPGCREPDCYLRSTFTRGTAELAAGRQIRCDAFDPVLNRFLAIQAEPARRRPSLHQAVPGLEGIMAVVTFDDVTDLRAPNNRLNRINRHLGEQVVRERNKRRQVEAVWMRMQAIVECTAGFAAMTDANGQLIYLNPAGRELLGIDADEDISAMSAIELHAESARAQMVSEAIPAAIAAGSWSGRSVLRKRDGADIEAHLVVLAHRTQDGRFEGVSILMQDMSEWIKGEQALRQSHQELKRLSEQLIAVQESERQRIAGDLHDGIGQALTLLKMHVRGVMEKLDSGATAEARRLLDGLMPKIDGTMAEVRQLSTELHPSSLEDLGIMATLSWFFRELESACCHIAVEKEFSVRESDVPPSLRVAIFRILQEAVNNIVKHAAPKRINVKLEKRGDDLQLCIEDDGRGFDRASIAARDPRGHGFGLSSMRERAKLSGGIYELHSAVGQGTRISVVWPAMAMGN